MAAESQAGNFFWQRCSLCERNAEHRLGKLEWEFTFEPGRCPAFQPRAFLIFLRNQREFGLFEIKRQKICWPQADFSG